MDDQHEQMRGKQPAVTMKDAPEKEPASESPHASNVSPKILIEPTGSTPYHPQRRLRPYLRLRLLGAKPNMLVRNDKKGCQKTLRAEV